MDREDDRSSPTPAPTPGDPSPAPGQAPPVPPEQAPPTQPAYGQPPGPPPGQPPRKRRRRGPQPAPPGVPYHLVLSDEKRRIWRGIAALALLMGGMLAFAVGFSYIGLFIDMALGRSNLMMEDGTEFTPALQAAALLGIALLLPWSMLIQRWLYGVKGASLHSVRSLFRPDVFGRAFLVILPVWAVYLTLFSALAPQEEGHWPVGDLLVMFAVILLLAPLQSAGEEYGFRGLAFRVAASWGRGPHAALVLGVVVSSLLFTVAHLTLDPWLNVYYFTMGVALALITWRTGGLEIAVVIHAVNNTLAFLMAALMRDDFAEGMDRSAGAGSPVMLVPCVLLVAITIVVWRRTRRTGPALTDAAPGSTPVPPVARGT